jgi:hypothetical protein
VAEPLPGQLPVEYNTGINPSLHRLCRRLETSLCRRCRRMPAHKRRLLRGSSSSVCASTGLWARASSTRSGR